MSRVSSRILFVDDEPNVLAGLQRLLRRRFEMFTANSGAEGLEILRREGPFAVVVSDYNMPGMNGVEFLGEVIKEAAETVTVLLTGLTDASVAAAALQQGRIFRYLNKPCERETLERTLEDCLEQHRLVVSERLLREELAELTGQLHQTNLRLERRVEERTARLRSLYEFVAGLNGLDGLGGVAELVVDTTAKMLHSRRVFLMLPDDADEHLTIVAARGGPPGEWEQMRIPLDDEVVGAAFTRGKASILGGPFCAPRETGGSRCDLLAVAPSVVIPLKAAHRVVGVLVVAEPLTGRPYDEDEVETLKAVADAAAIAIHNQIRLQERNQAQEAIILALARLAEHRDPETGEHLERVQYYCRMLSEELAKIPKYQDIIDSEFIDNIFRTAPLHDIGKVGIRDHILLKPGKLTPEEFEVMKAHTTIGGNTIRTLIAQHRRQTFLQMGMEIAYQHHEKYDGSGYPRGLKGEEICLSARIVALADVYDALTSRRPYKEPMTHAQAVEIIRREDGKHFDPDVVAAFFRREEEFRRLAEGHQDRWTAPSAAGHPTVAPLPRRPTQTVPPPEPVSA